MFCWFIIIPRKPSICKVVATTELGDLSNEVMCSLRDGPPENCEAWEQTWVRLKIKQATSEQPEKGVDI